jgi:serine/threonine-protein kinase RsbW
VTTSGLRGPGWRVVDARPGHVRVIRDWISSAVTRYDCPVDPEDAALAVGELFTNAVAHGPAGGRVLVGYCLWPEGARIVVCDGGGCGTPELRQAADLAEGGRGLQVVDWITAQWGYSRFAGNLIVWCDFGQPLHARAGDAWAWLRCLLSADAPLSVPVPAHVALPPEPPEADLAVPVRAARMSAPSRTFNHLETASPSTAQRGRYPAHPVAAARAATPCEQALSARFPGTRRASSVAACGKPDGRCS